MSRQPSEATTPTMEQSVEPRLDVTITISSSEVSSPTAVSPDSPKKQNETHAFVSPASGNPSEEPSQPPSASANATAHEEGEAASTTGNRPDPYATQLRLGNTSVILAQSENPCFVPISSTAGAVSAGITEQNTNPHAVSRWIAACVVAREMTQHTVDYVKKNPMTGVAAGISAMLMSIGEACIHGVGPVIKEYQSTCQAPSGAGFSSDAVAIGGSIITGVALFAMVRKVQDYRASRSEGYQPLNREEGPIV